MTRSKNNIKVFLACTSAQSQTPFFHNLIPVPDLQSTRLTNALEILLFLKLIKNDPKILYECAGIHNFEKFAVVEGDINIQQKDRIERREALLDLLKLGTYVSIPGI
jgi:hypothetical protein